jgi:hypothetical protein
MATPADECLRQHRDKIEISDLVVAFHAHYHRWHWDQLPGLLTQDCVVTTCIDRIPVVTNWEQGTVDSTEPTSWRETAQVRGQHQWSIVTVTVDDDTSTVLMTGTQTNTFPDGYSEISGILQDVICRRTPDGWRIAWLRGSYESNHPRLSELFASAGPA